MLDKQTNLAQVRVQQFGDRLLVWTTIKYPSSSGGIAIRPDVDEAASNRGLCSINGSIIALDAETGRMLWDRAGMLNRLNIQLGSTTQFAVCGLLPRRQHWWFAHSACGCGRSARWHAGFFNSNLPLNNQGIESSEFTMRVDPTRHIIVLTVGTTAVTLKVTDEEKPPQPVCFLRCDWSSQARASSFLDAF